jgi:DNA-binding SARP family transcriptional activator/tetratricopeptide (TPR) repeat protein
VADLSLALLGPPVVERDGDRVTFDTKKAVAVLALLGATGRDQSRDRLATLLWPESDTTHARGSLRRTLSVTAAAVGEGLVISRAAVALRPGGMRVDVADFEALAARPDTAALERAARLYRDEFLAGFSLRGCPEFDDWQSSVAGRLRRVLAGCLERLAAACAAAGEPDLGLDHIRRWLSLDPMHEPAHQAMIRALAWTGQRSAAVRQYRELVGILDRELAVRPLPETTRLYDNIRAGRLEPPPGRPRRGTDGHRSGSATGPAQAGSARGRAPAVPGRASASGRGSSSGSAVASGSASASGRGSSSGSAVASGSASVSGSASAAARATRPTVPAGAGTGQSTAEHRWPLVGRTAELGILGAAWREATARSTGQVVAVTGEAGCGKTALIGEFHAGLDTARGVVLRGRCHDGESGLPFALAADLLRSAGVVSPDLPVRLPSHVAVTVGRLAPELATEQPNAPVPTLSSPLALARLYAAIRTTFQLAAAPAGQPGVLIVEDVHWADRPSVDLLAYLVRRLAGWPVLLVLSWRPEHAERLRGLHAALNEAAESGQARTVEPRLLSADEVAEVLRAAGLPQPDVPRMLSETRGLPMLVREYAEALRAVGQDGGEAWSPPESVRGLLGRRLRSAGEPAAQMLSTAAVLGSGCDADLLRAVSGRGEAETVEALDEAVARFLLIELPPPGGSGAPSYDFPYEALRRVAYESASLARRRLLHGRAADVLAVRYERDQISVRAAVVAGHLQRAGREPEAASWWWRAAARARELYAHTEAYAHLRQALALGYPHLPGHIAAGDVLTVLGRYREALAAYETAAAASDGDHATSAAIEHKLAEVHHRLGDWALADAHLAAAADLLPADDLSGRARAGADRAVVAYRLGEYERAAVLGGTALADAGRAADPAAIAQAHNVLGMLAASGGDTGAAEEHLRGSLAEARQRGDPGAAAAALNNLARLLADTGRAEEALGCATEALVLGSELGDQHRVAALHTNLADLLHASGQRDEAMKHLKEAARRFAALDAGGMPRPEIWTLVEW